MDKLYHYTDFNGLKGILESQCLWATHFKFLNDLTETIYSQKKLSEFLSQEKFIDSITKNLSTHRTLREKNQKFIIEDKNGYQSAVKEEISGLIEVCHKANKGIPYILSFCKHDNDYIQKNGLLSQWRGYSEDGGYAIEFDGEKILEYFKKEFENFCLSILASNDVDYSEDISKFHKRFESELPIIESYLSDLIVERFYGNDFPKPSEEFFKNICNIMFYHKHHAFSEEKEFRLVALLQNNYDKDIEEGNERKPEKIVKFREKKGSLVPYIELFKNSDSNLSVDNLRQSNISLPINRIIVGPHKDKDNRSTLLQQILRNTNIQVHTSDIPYISF